MLLAIVGLLLIAGILLAALVVKEAQQLPSIAQLPNTSRSTVIYDQSGKPVTTLWGNSSMPVQLQDVPSSLINALIDTEDIRFYQDPLGIDPRGILRAIYVDLQHGGRPVQGASTISEQLADIHYLGHQKSVLRKLNQALLAVEINRRYTKQEILQMYLNQVYLGQGATGVNAAAHIYFGVDVSKLTLAQAAVIAGLPQAPSADNPFASLARAKARQKQVLDHMVRAKTITQAQADAAYKAPLNLATPSSSQQYRYPWFVDAVVRRLQSHGFTLPQLLHGGYKIYTTLDPTLQDEANKAVADVMNKAFPIKGKSTPQPEAAMVVMDPTNGHVLAVVGGRVHAGILDYNRATQMYRQTGSSIKPLAEYPTAIMMGYTEASVVDDGPWMFRNGKPWPQNDNFVYEGRLTLRKALAISDNNVAVRLLNMVGIDNAFNTATQKFGLPLVASGKYNDKTLSMGIGGLTRGITPLDAASAYSTFANNGRRASPMFITKVENAQGQVVYNNTPTVTPELTPQVNAIMVHMMQAVVQGGTGQYTKLYYQGQQRPTAGKTGTSNAGRDGWYDGYIPQLVTVVWEGKDNDTPQPHVFGATYAAPIWTQFMKMATAKMPVQNFPQPSGLTTANVDVKSGLLPGPLTPQQYVQPYEFIQGTVPTQTSSIWTQVQVDAQKPTTLWAPQCLPDQPQTKVLLKRPTDIQILQGYSYAEKPLWVPAKYCDGTPVTGPPTSSPAPSPSSSGPASNPNAQQVQVLVINQQFQPGSISVTQGQPVQLTVQSRAVQAYDFTLNAFGVGTQQLPPAYSTRISFFPDTPGTYTFSLTDPSTQSVLATGQLTVTPATSSTGGGGGSGGSGSQASLTVSGQQFQPQALSVPRGPQATLTVTNQDARAYTFTLRAFGIVNRKLPPGATQRLTIHPTSAGTYAFSLARPGGRRAVASGLLTVQSASSASSSSGP